MKDSDSSLEILGEIPVDGERHEMTENFVIIMKNSINHKAITKLLSFPMSHQQTPVILIAEKVDKNLPYFNR